MAKLERYKCLENFMTMSRLITASTTLLLATGPAFAQMGAAEKPAAENQDALSTLNAEFRAVYKQAKENCAEKTLPLIMCLGDDMILIDGDLRDQVNFIPPRYTQLKVVDHVPLALFVLLNANCDRPLNENEKQQLTKIKTLVSAARPALSGLGLEQEVLSRQYHLLDSATDFLEKVLQQGQVARTELFAFCRKVEPMVMQNVDQAVAAQLSIIDATVSRWREKLGPDKFNKLTVVIVSGHMPRERHTCFQYFSKLMHVKKEGLKIVYSEGQGDEQSARDFVGMHVLDASIGESFFKEKLRMHRDLLSDGAAKYLKAHPPLSNEKKKG